MVKLKRNTLKSTLAVLVMLVSLVNTAHASGITDLNKNNVKLVVNDYSTQMVTYSNRSAEFIPVSNIIESTKGLGYNVRGLGIARGIYKLQEDYENNKLDEYIDMFTLGNKYNIEFVKTGNTYKINYPKIVSNGRSYNWHVNQLNSGEYKNTNCGPSAAHMVMKWVDKDYKLTTSDIRNTNIAGGGGWHNEVFRQFLKSQGVKHEVVIHKDINTVKDIIDKGGIAVLSVRYKHLVDYDTENGHYIVVHGYAEVDKKLDTPIKNIKVKGNLSKGVNFVINTLNSKIVKKEIRFIANDSSNLQDYADGEYSDSVIYDGDKLDTSLTEWWDDRIIVVYE